MSDTYLIIRNDTVVNVVVGTNNDPHFEWVHQTPDLSHVSIGWTRDDKGVFIAPVNLDGIVLGLVAQTIT